MPSRLGRLLRGRPRDFSDPHIHHQISLAAVLAWVGLGADGLSSSAYGPEEAYKALMPLTGLGLLLALMTAGTVFLISFCYSRLIEEFPSGGGGYLVASKLLGPKLGLVAGCALVVDYILTITVSIASMGDQLFSFLPERWQAGRTKLGIEFVVLVVLILINLRGVRESVAVLLPIFAVFLISHAAMILSVLVQNAGKLPSLPVEAAVELRSGVASLGAMGLFLFVMRAFSLGGGTYTGIEAVSNGLAVMREPRVPTAKRTMLYMALSLAVTAGGIIVGYLLVSAHPVPGKTLNAVLAESVFGGFTVLGVQVGSFLVILTLASAGALLMVAAETGFLGGPRTLSVMAVDSWVPRRFATLSDRLVTQNGVVLMGGAALLLMLATQGRTGLLVVMYSINVFVTFSLSMLGMSRLWFNRRATNGWQRPFSLFVVGSIVCLAILVLMTYEKFTEGGWITIVITGGLCIACALIKAHYGFVLRQLKRLDEILGSFPVPEGIPDPGLPDPREPVAVVLVPRYGGLGVHSLLTVQRTFPGFFKGYVFVSVGVIDSANFKGVEGVEDLRESIRADLDRYVSLARSLGLPSDSAMKMGTEAVEVLEAICAEVGRKYPRAVFFVGKLVFQRERWFNRLLHNETAYAIQRRLQFAGLQTVILPIRVLESS
jgi:amino acid transporter